MSQYSFKSQITIGNIDVPIRVDIISQDIDQNGEGEIIFNVYLRNENGGTGWTLLDDTITDANYDWIRDEAADHIINVYEAERLDAMERSRFDR